MQYPNLYELIEMCREFGDDCNNYRVRQDPDWSNLGDLPALEATAAKLSPEQKDELINDSGNACLQDWYGEAEKALDRFLDACMEPWNRERFIEPVVFEPKGD
jgi:hypothetical protein